MKKLIVGLGNPGKQYTNTRHNVGFMVLNDVIERWEIQPAWGAALAKKGAALYLKPVTYMNLSGAAVAAVSRYYKIAPADVLVIYDDKDLPFGAIRFRKQGSAGGHKGMQSIISTLGTTVIPRLKIGIAPADRQPIVDTAEYVLEKFTKEEQKQLENIISAAKLKLKEWLATKQFAKN